MVLAGRRDQVRVRMFLALIPVARVGDVARVLGWRQVPIRRGRILRCRVVVLSGVDAVRPWIRWVRLVGLCANRGWRRR